MNESSPAPNAASSVTFSITACLPTGISGMTAPLRSSPSICTLWPFTGGRSWNMKSHFQRSDGFDACSQLRAGTGRANDERRRPAHRRVPGIAAAMRAADVGGARVGQASARATRRRSPGSASLRAPRPEARSRARRACTRPWSFGIDRVLFDVGGARQHEIGRRGQLASSRRPAR